MNCLLIHYQIRFKFPDVLRNKRRKIDNMQVIGSLVDCDSAPEFPDVTSN